MRVGIGKNKTEEQTEYSDMVAKKKKQTRTRFTKLEHSVATSHRFYCVNRLICNRFVYDHLYKEKKIWD